MHFVLIILFVLTLAAENDTFSILVLSTKKRYSSFWKKVFVFQKICFKIKVLTTFKISIDVHIKTCRSLKRRAILKIPEAATGGALLERPATSLKKRLWHRCFPVNFEKFLRVHFWQNTSGWLLLKSPVPVSEESTLFLLALRWNL